MKGVHIHQMQRRRDRENDKTTWYEMEKSIQQNRLINRKHLNSEHTQINQPNDELTTYCDS